MKKHRPLPSDPVRDPEFARRLFRTSALYLPVALISTLVTLALVAFEIGLFRSESRALIVIGAMLMILHASYLVNTMMQARMALADLDRCVRGREPRRFTPDVMARSIKSVHSHGLRVGFLPHVLTVATPFYPIAVWAVGEILFLNGKDVRERMADISADEHRVRRSGPDGHGARDVVRTSKDVVLGQARRSVLVSGV